RDFEALFASIRECPKLVIAAVHGYAVGAGFQLALVCDVIVAADTAKFGMTEINVGIPCITGSGLLWPNLGRNKISQIIQFGGFLSAKEAHDLGLVVEVVPAAELPAAADRWARAAADKPPNVIALNKR